jgi:hypothetical protein
MKSKGHSHFPSEKNALDGEKVWCTPKLFDRLNYKSKVKTSKG